MIKDSAQKDKNVALKIISKLKTPIMTSTTRRRIKSCNESLCSLLQVEEIDLIGLRSEPIMKKSTIVGGHRIEYELPDGSTLILDLSVQKLFLSGEERFVCEVEDKTQEIKLRSREGEIVETLVQANLNLFKVDMMKDPSKKSILKVWMKPITCQGWRRGHNYLIISEGSVKRR